MKRYLNMEHPGYGPYQKKQRRAQVLVRKAKRGGALEIGLCAHADHTCKGQIEAHHEDYDKPLEVVWLCHRHHKRLHIDRRDEFAAQMERAA